MKCLIVTAHPLANSLCASLAGHALTCLKTAGHNVVVEDLYQDSFHPALTEAERDSYYSDKFEYQAIEKQVENLQTAEAIVLVFPTWWFGFPAIMKGWFDRVWGPGIAYDHTENFGPIKARLLDLKNMLAITTYGAPWWIDTLIMRRPTRRILKTALLSTCAPNCKFEMLSAYKCEDLSESDVNRLQGRIGKVLKGWFV